jgi:hypothetical protein
VSPNKLHIAFARYFATGEGVSIFIAVGGSYALAEDIFRKNVPEYFYPCMKVEPVESQDEEVLLITALLPEAILKIFSDNLPGSTEYFSKVHYNLS